MYLALYTRQQSPVDVLQQLAAAHIAHPLAELAPHLLLVASLLFALRLFLVLHQLLCLVVRIVLLEQLERVQLPQPSP